MKVYVASKFERKREVNELQTMLIAEGHEITADWTKFSAVGRQNGELVSYLRGAAEFDLDGVRSCDALVLIHDDRCAGGFVELGAALALGKMVAVIGGRCREVMPIFYNHPGVEHFETWEKCIDWLDWHESHFMPKRERQS